MNKCKLCGENENLIRQAKWEDSNGNIKYIYYCRECASERGRKYRKTERGKEVYRNMMRKQYVENKEKVKARQNLNYHLKMKHITKPDKCSNCQKVTKTEGHHEDYTKPLKVIWLCKGCHLLV